MWWWSQSRYRLVSPFCYSMDNSLEFLAYPFLSSVFLSSSNSAMPRITPYGFVCLLVYLFFLFDCFASLSILVSTLLSTIHFFEVLGVKGGTGEGSRLARSGISRKQSRKSCSTSSITFLGSVSAGLAYKHFADLTTVGGQEPVVLESATTTLMQSCSGQYTSAWSSVGRYTCTCATTY